MKIRKYNKKSSYSYSLGIYPTIELLKKMPGKVIGLYRGSRLEKGEGFGILDELARKNGLLLEENDAAISRLADKESVYAVGVFKTYDSPISAGANHLVLDRPQNFGNLGTIIRTMAAFGFRDLAIIKPAADIFSPKVIRASMGALFGLNFSYFDSMSDYRAKCGGRHLYYFAKEGEATLRDVVFQEPYSLVFGNEASGLDPREYGHGTAVRIGQSSEVDSLNLSTAVGIALHRAYSSGRRGRT